MKVLSIAALLCALALTLPARAQTKNAFSGVWVLDASKSVLMDASRRDIELRVRDNGSSVRVAQPVATAKRVAEVVYECTTDGKPGEQRMSGVVYALFGYIWITGLLDGERINIQPEGFDQTHRRGGGKHRLNVNESKWKPLGIGSELLIDVAHAAVVFRSRVLGAGLQIGRVAEQVRRVGDR